jgi:hypothetical protein
VEAAHERLALAVPALGVEEPRLVEGSRRELRELLREPQLLRREGESAAPRHREEAEHEIARVERQAHAAAARRIRAGLVLEGGAVRREGAAEQLVRVERATAGPRAFAARRSALVEDLRDLARLRMESIGRHAVEFELARQRGDREANDFVRIQGEERPGGELEERDGLLAPFHEQSERALAFEDVAHRAREDADGFLGFRLAGARRLHDDAESGLHLVLHLHGRSEERQRALAGFFRAPLRENLAEVLVEPGLGGGGDAGSARAGHGRNTGAGKQGDDRRIEEMEGCRQDAAERIVQEETLLEGAVERLEKRQAVKT